MTFKQWGNLGIRVGAVVFLGGLELYAAGREVAKKLRRPSPSRTGANAKARPVVKAESAARPDFGPS